MMNIKILKGCYHGIILDDLFYEIYLSVLNIDTCFIKGKGMLIRSKSHEYKFIKMKCDPLSYCLFNKSMLVMNEFIECDFEDDFGFYKCLIHTYDMRHILNMNHVQCFNHVTSP